MLKILGLRVSNEKGAKAPHIGFFDRLIEEGQAKLSAKSKQNAEHQAAFRVRMLEEKRTEVRGMYATKEDSAKIKEFAKTLLNN